MTSERNVFIFSAADGTKIGRFIMPAASWSSPTPCNGRLYVGANDWNLYCLAEYNTANNRLTINLDKSRIASGELVTVAGQLSPASVQTVTLTFTRPDGSKDTLTVTTSNDGSFSDTYQPNAVGVWTVTASCQSDTQTLTSESLSLEVTESSTANEILAQNWVYILIIVIGALLVLLAAVVYTRRRTKM
jgi:cobalamin biosynthesis Mg chelatase CobN